MLALLVEGRRAENGTYYVHPGDLRWWLFYTTRKRWDDIYLWEGEDGGLLGWALLSPDWEAFDVFYRPGLRGSAEAAGMFAWAEGEISRVACAPGGNTIRTMWISARDEFLASLLEWRNFTRAGVYQSHLVALLDKPLTAPVLPPGFRLRSCSGEVEVEKRAAVQYAAFGSSISYDRYCARFLRFMRSPAYHPELDIVIIAPDGRFAAFCICWFDPVHRVGLFEPVGTHPDFQRKGLGKAVLLEGLKRMQEHGMQSAIVGGMSDNPAASSLYESVGFQEQDRIVTYEKAIQGE
jgi:mycothiol synthase